VLPHTHTLLRTNFTQVSRAFYPKCASSLLCNAWLGRGRRRIPLLHSPFTAPSLYFSSFASPGLVSDLLQAVPRLPVSHSHQLFFFYDPSLFQKRSTRLLKPSSLLFLLVYYYHISVLFPSAKTTWSAHVISSLLLVHPFVTLLPCTKVRRTTGHTHACTQLLVNHHLFLSSLCAVIGFRSLPPPPLCIRCNLVVSAFRACQSAFPCV
jgi:hypothetical protein